MELQVVWVTAFQELKQCQENNWGQCAQQLLGANTHLPKKLPNRPPDQIETLPWDTMVLGIAHAGL